MPPSCRPPWPRPAPGPEEYRWAPGSELGYKPFPQLFDLSVDPREQQNVAGEQPDVVREMETLLAAERAAGPSRFTRFLRNFA